MSYARLVFENHTDVFIEVINDAPNSYHDRNSILVLKAFIYIFQVSKPLGPRPISDALELNESESDCRT